MANFRAIAATGMTLYVDGVAVTPVLGADADFVDIGSEELNHILDYVQHVASFKEGGQEFLNTQDLLKSFLAGAAFRNSALKASARFREWLGVSRDDESVRKYQTPERVGVR